MELDKLAKSNVLEKIMQMFDEDVGNKIKGNKPKAISISVQVAKPIEHGKMKALRDKLEGKECPMCGEYPCECED